MKIVLASESPFRKRALDIIGVPYEVFPSRFDEKAIRDHDPARLTLKLAEAKARHIADQRPDAIIVSGDAVASKEARIFEKPRDHQEAAAFLRELSGSEFQFVTALAVLRAQTGRMLSAVETLDIAFRPLIEREIQDYICRYDVLSYAGAFEDDAVHRFADRISGSYNIGTALPVSRLIVLLREQGAEVSGGMRLGRLCHKWGIFERLAELIEIGWKAIAAGLTSYPPAE
jgi:septum formation protein